MRFPNLWYRRNIFNVVCVLSIFSTVPIAQAIDEIPSSNEAAQLGLVIHWQAQTERSRTGTGETGVVLWPHTKLRKEIITIRVGDRIVERIDANDIDASAADQSVLSTNKGSKLPRLGIEMARKQAEKTVARYAKIGRKAFVEEINQPVTYLIAASNDGAVRALDAESGELFWSTSIGNNSLPTWGPGVNDRFVTLANGMDLYILELANGRLVGKKRLTESASTVAQPIGPLVYVPGIHGTLTAYEGDDLKVEPITLRFTGTLNSPVVASKDERFVAWPNKNHLYIAQGGRKFVLWSRIESTSMFPTMPQLTNDGFVAVSATGMVYRVNLNRTDSIVWRENLATAVAATPLVASDLIMVVSDVGDCYALDEKTGEVLWTSEQPDIKKVLAVTTRRVYAQRKAGQLVSIDRSTGKTIANLNREFAIGLFNNVNDRVILQSPNGSLLCLREPESIYPVMNLPASAKPGLAKKEGASKTNEPAPDMTASPNLGDSLFGEPPKADATATPMTDDPFGAPATGNKPADPLNPFGT